MLSEQTKARIRYHQGYLGVSNAAGFNLGVPAALQTQFMIEQAMQVVLPSAEGKLLEVLDNLDAVEAQIVENMENIAVKKIDTIEVNLDEFTGLITRYKYWQGAVANITGCPPNEFDQRFGGYLSGGGSSSINIPVRH